MFGRSRHGALRRLIRANVVVGTHGDKVFDGLLWDQDDRVVVLRNARVLDVDGWVPMDGEVVLDRLDVAYLQFP